MQIQPTREPVSRSLTKVGEIATNLVHTWFEDVAEKIKTGPYYAQYSAWNFCGAVYWVADLQEYVCEIWRYHCLIDVIHAKTGPEIMEIACEKYGFE